MAGGLALRPKPVDRPLPFPLIWPGQLHRWSAGPGRADGCPAFADAAFEPIAHRTQPVIPALAMKPPPQLMRVEDRDPAALRLPANGEDVDVPGGALKQVGRDATAILVKSCHRVGQDWRAANNSV